jgi:putative hydrolase of the HAD superfamily
MQEPQITTVAVDYGGVLSREIEEEALCHMANVMGVRPETFVPALWRHRPPYDRGEITAFEYWGRVMQECDVHFSAEQLPAAADLLHRLDGIGWSVLNPALLRWLHELRSHGYRLLILSNMACETYNIILKHSVLRDCTDKILISGTAGVNKPDRRIYEAAVRLMETSPEKMLFIDDLKKNVEGAVSVGLHALQFGSAAELSCDLQNRFPSIPRSGLLCRKES